MTATRTIKSRFTKLVEWDAETLRGVMRITQDGVEDYYGIRLESADYGIYFRIVKTSGEIYDVNISLPGGFSTCDCPSSEYGRGRKCKHVEAIEALIAAKKFAVPANDIREMRQCDE